MPCQSVDIFKILIHWLVVPVAIRPAWLFTQIHNKIILFLLFWDVLWIINYLLAPMSLFFHEFQQNSQFLRPISLSNKSDLGRVAYNHEYTQIYIKISSFKSLIYINYFYIFSHNLILKILQRWRQCRIEILMKKSISISSQCRLQQWRWWILMDISPNTCE